MIEQIRICRLNHSAIVSYCSQLTAELHRSYPCAFVAGQWRSDGSARSKTVCTKSPVYLYPPLQVAPSCKHLAREKYRHLATPRGRRIPTCLFLGMLVNSESSLQHPPRGLDDISYPPVIYSLCMFSYSTMYPGCGAIGGNITMPALNHGNESRILHLRCSHRTPS